MLSKKIEFNFLNLFKKSKSSPLKESGTKGKRIGAMEEFDLQTKVSGFAIGFFITLALVALIFSIGLASI